MSGTRRTQYSPLVVSLCEQPVVCRLVDPLGFLLLACQQGDPTQSKQHVPASSVGRTQQGQDGAILGHGLFEGSGLKCLCGSTQRVRDAPLLVTTVREVEGQIGELRRTQTLLVSSARFQDLPNHAMQASTPGGADFSIQACTDVVMTEEEVTCLLSAHEPSMHRLKQAFLHRFDFLLLHPGEQGKLKVAPDDRGHAQVINYGWREPSEALAQCPDNTGRERLFERCDSDPLLVL